MVYGDDESVVRETYENIDSVEREDGWVVLFRGREAVPTRAIAPKAR
jgi:hypothetical protein